MEPGYGLSLYDRLGGRVFTVLIAEKFCDRMHTDPHLSDLLREADPNRLKETLTGLARELLSGNDADAVKLLVGIGKQVTVSQSHFNRGISHLIAALIWAGIGRELIEEILDVVTPLSAHLVRPAKPAEEGDA